MPKAVVLMSGGMDSSLCAALARESGYDIAALHLNYGQKTQARELKAFNDIADYYGAVERLVIDISHLSKIGGSSLTDDTIPVTLADLENKEIPSSYVPFRNANLLSIAVSWAEVIGATAVSIGAMEEDGSGYPDCRAVFFDAFRQSVQYGTKPSSGIEVLTPIINFTKKEIVTEGMKLGVPFHLTWSCYKSQDQACGVCDSCALRLRGFSQAGYEDPLDYLVHPEYK